MHLSSAFHLHHPPFSLLQSSSKTLTFLSKLSQIQNPRPTFSPFSSSSPNWIQHWGKTGFLTKRPQSAVDYKAGFSSDEDEVGTSRSTGTSTMAKIVDRLKKFGYTDEQEEQNGASVVEDIFYCEDGILPNERGGLDLDLKEVIKFPWERKLDEKKSREDEEERRKRSKTALAELTLPADELRRLRHMAIRVKSRTKIGGAGVTKQIVDLIHEKWRTDEVVRLKCEGPPALNMKRMHEILERKTGGLVIWRSGTSVSLYRGVSYKIPFQNSLPKGRNNQPQPQTSHIPTQVKDQTQTETNHITLQLKPQTKTKTETEEQKELNYEDEIDILLDELGPRYTDWPGSGPLPVDADLLPGSVEGYEPPLRVLPYGVRPFLGRKDSTDLKRLARSLPPHFALGRSRQHQGLAAAMIKLWEKSCIAKIAWKRGVQLTNSERMAEEIKKLTGGVILSRSKEFIVFYRGKNFLCHELTQALLERERLAKSLQDEEEQARHRASNSINFGTSNSADTGVDFGTSNNTGTDFGTSNNTGTDFGTSNNTGIGTGTLEETLEAKSKYRNEIDEEKIVKEVEMARHMQLVNKLEMKLRMAERKVERAERALGKVEEKLKPTEMREPETITDEERYMFRKLGLKMKAFLLLGRRGVFDGTVENMHLHWKYRELIKILIKCKNFREVKQIALALEAESGGVLVSVDKVSKGYAIIVYRGKEYHRPAQIRPRNLLSKRKALARSIELQRHQALSGHIAKLSKKAEQLKNELAQMEEVKDGGDEGLYDKLDSSYSSEAEEASGSEDDMEKGDINDVNKFEDAAHLEDVHENMDDDYDDNNADDGDDDYSYNESDDENDLHEHNSLSEQESGYSKC